LHAHARGWGIAWGGDARTLAFSAIIASAVWNSVNPMPDAQGAFTCGRRGMHGNQDLKTHTAVESTRVSLLIIDDNKSS
jgi:hypothetical protein